MTVYRRFGGRQQLLDDLAVRECRRCLARIASDDEQQTRQTVPALLAPLLSRGVRRRAQAAAGDWPKAAPARAV